MNSGHEKSLKKAKPSKADLQLPPVVDFKDLTNGENPVVMIRLEDGSIYRLQKTKFGKLLLSK